MTIEYQGNTLSAFGIANIYYCYFEKKTIMAKRPKSHHIVPNPDGGWDVKRGGGHRATSHHDTKLEAIDAGRKVSRNQGSELRIHNKDGRIASSDSHGGDPYPPKG